MENKNQDNLTLVLFKVEEEVRKNYSAAKTLMNTYQTLLRKYEHNIHLDDVNFNDHLSAFERIKKVVQDEIKTLLEYEDYKLVDTLAMIEDRILASEYVLNRIIEKQRTYSNLLINRLSKQ
ncbi:hypothetical protein [Heyndrickxia camelliae]|uniref:Uncharacterized protein n=1 Tax=Heyndrickxia camelliae TaxID=1707093 RepID=A0A2N3LG69_9BACI|nr:hypothetical protein [Heyndrickxia camelliae]PKR83555.1 hypothetical protein CWO92_18495 [Heyndrickxia camelliae]